MSTWDTIANDVAAHPGIKSKKGTALNRFDKLMSSFKRGEQVSHRKSGAPEEYEERDRLLTDISARMSDFTESVDPRRDAGKRKAEGIETSGV
ncbi:Aste57867_8296 [Aphanomyces stellatus]|uniref:Aste57867_8296 protein n=1 Tax=Aphanomyces stellatus TaxID=120398 RepID=A0A485KJX8_9STRA|nr:hypothetical protein As57867_008265 [Aphanomyces stellatus]VFT85183.1 Aste57867_8296 [Aphanomyces stellatus]